MHPPTILYTIQKNLGAWEVLCASSVIATFYVEVVARYHAHCWNKRSQPRAKTLARLLTTK